MPKLEVRLTDRQMERLNAAATAAGMNRSDYVRWLCLREEPGPKGAHTRREKGLKARAQAAQEAKRGANMPVDITPSHHPFLTPQMVAMQGAVTYAHAETLIRAGRVQLENGHLLIDGKPV